MANILDILRTHTGKRLLERSREISGLEVEALQQAFVYTLPALLCVYEKKGSSDNEKPEDLIRFVENGNLTAFGEKETEFLFKDSERKIFLEFSTILNIKGDTFKDILYISAAVIAIIISEIKEKRNAEFRDILKTLCGTDTKFDEDFIKVIIKNPEDANIIESGEEIALGKKNDDDPSILGGYTGGR